MHDSLNAVIQAEYCNIIVEGDKKTLIQALEWHIQVPWQIHNIVKDILKRRGQCIQITINHIFRKANMAVD